jgi:hypothetical protein
MKLCLLAFALGAIGCVEQPTSTTEQTVRYRDHIQPIWDQWCVRCHNFHTPHLNATESARDLAGVSWAKCDGETKARFVVPGAPAQSYLLFKLTGENTNNYIAGCNRPMPADQMGVDTPLASLDPEAVATIRRWIEEGADFE